MTLQVFVGGQLASPSVGLQNGSPQIRPSELSCPITQLTPRFPHVSHLQPLWGVGISPSGLLLLCAHLHLEKEARDSPVYSERPAPERGGADGGE